MGQETSVESSFEKFKESFEELQTQSDQYFGEVTIFRNVRAHE